MIAHFNVLRLSTHVDSHTLVHTSAAVIPSRDPRTPVPVDTSRNGSSVEGACKETHQLCQLYYDSRSIALLDSGYPIACSLEPPLVPIHYPIVPALCLYIVRTCTCLTPSLRYYTYSYTFHTAHNLHSTCVPHTHSP